MNVYEAKSVIAYMDTIKIENANLYSDEDAAQLTKMVSERIKAASDVCQTMKRQWNASFICEIIKDLDGKKGQNTSKLLLQASKVHTVALSKVASFLSKQNVPKEIAQVSAALFGVHLLIEGKKASDQWLDEVEKEVHKILPLLTKFKLTMDQTGEQTKAPIKLFIERCTAVLKGIQCQIDNKLSSNLTQEERERLDALKKMLKDI